MTAQSERDLNNLHFHRSRSRIYKHKIDDQILESIMPTHFHTHNQGKTLQVTTNDTSILKGIYNGLTPNIYPMIFFLLHHLSWMA